MKKSSQETPLFPHWDSWSVWKHRNPVMSFVGKNFFSGLISAIGSVLMYIILFYVIFLSWDKLKGDKDNNKDTSRTLTTALQLGSPLLYQKMNDTNV